MLGGVLRELVEQRRPLAQQLDLWPVSGPAFRDELCAAMTLRSNLSSAHRLSSQTMKSPDSQTGVHSVLDYVPPEEYEAVYPVHRRLACAARQSSFDTAKKPRADLLAVPGNHPMHHRLKTLHVRIVKSVGKVTSTT